MSIQNIFDYIKNFLTEFFADSFTSCSKKNFILTTLLLQMQYRLTPLTPLKKERKSFFNKKFLRHTYFLEALEGLDRSVRVVEALHIDLHHLFSVKSAAVGHRNGDVHAGTCPYRLL